MSDINFFVQKMSDQVFKLDKLIANCDYIKKHCNHFQSNYDDKLIEKFDDLLQASRFIDEIAGQFCTENFTLNGFVLYNRIVTSYTDQLVKQVKTKNKLDSNFLKILTLIFKYKDWLIDTYETILNEEKVNNNEIQKEKLLIVKSFTVSSRFFYSTLQ